MAVEIFTEHSDSVVARTLSVRRARGELEALRVVVVNRFGWSRSGASRAGRVGINNEIVER